MDGSKQILITIESPYVFKKFQKFSSYAEVEARLQLHSDHDFVYYSRRDTRAVKGPETKTPRALSPTLKYYVCKFACAQSSDPQGNQNERGRTNCPSHISLSASHCGEYLVVTSVCNDHNHDFSEVIRNSLSTARELLPEVRDEVEYMLQANIDRRKIADYVHVKTGQRLSTKDLHNIKTAAVRNNGIGYDISKKTEIVERIKEFIVHSSNMLERTLIESSRIDSDVESTTGSSLTSAPSESAWAQASEEENESLKYHNLFQPIDLQSQGQSDRISDLTESPTDQDNVYIGTNDFEMPAMSQQSEDISSVSNSSINVNGNSTVFLQVDPYISSPAMGITTTSLPAINNQQRRSMLPIQQTSSGISFTSEIIKPADQEVEYLESAIESMDAIEMNAADESKEESQPITKHTSGVEHKKNHAKKAKRPNTQCSTCGTDTRILKGEINVLRAEKVKLREQIKLLKLKKRKLLNDYELTKGCEQQI